MNEFFCTNSTFKCTFKFFYLNPRFQQSRMAEESNLKKRMISIINKHIESNPMTNENKKPKKEGEEE